MAGQIAEGSILILQADRADVGQQFQDRRLRNASQPDGAIDAGAFAETS